MSARLWLSTCVWCLLAGCTTPPAETPPAEIDDGWWTGQWEIDLDRLRPDDTLSAPAQATARRLAAALAPALVFDLDRQRIRRTLGAESSEQAIASTRIDARHAVLILANGFEATLRRDDDGAWLTDRAGTRPVRRPP